MPTQLPVVPTVIISNNIVKKKLLLPLMPLSHPLNTVVTTTLCIDVNFMLETLIKNRKKILSTTIVAIDIVRLDMGETR